MPTPVHLCTCLSPPTPHCTSALALSSPLLQVCVTCSHLAAHLCIRPHGPVLLTQQCLPNARTAVGGPAQGVDNVGLFSVMGYVLYLKHDALARQLCGFVSCSSSGIDPMQCECHGSWHSQKSDVCLTISKTTHDQCVRGSTSSCSRAGGGWPYVCVCAQ